MNKKLFGLAREQRIRKRREFLRVQRKGKRRSGQSVVLMAIRRASPIGRVGFTVPKNVGDAHVRNLVKRRLRHIIREHKEVFAGQDLVILALAKSASLSFSNLQTEFLSVADRMRS